MARKKKRKRAQPDPRRNREAADRPFHNPFRDQGKCIKRRLKEAAQAPDPERLRAEEEARERARTKQDQNAFLAAMGEVTPLADDRRTALPTAHPKPRPTDDEDLEVLAHLADLVSGEAVLDVRDTDEYVEGARPGLNPEVLKRLSSGLFPIHDELDLHGLTVAQAEEEVARLMVRARRLSHRCVLIIHGRGKSSPQGRPVLKSQLVAWLSRSRLRRDVLAFSTARPYDGGAGAMYVLLAG